MKVTKQTFATFTKEGASCKYYTSFFIHIQPAKAIKDRVNLLSVGELQKIPCYELDQIVFS